MNEVFEKIIEKLEEKRKSYENEYGMIDFQIQEDYKNAIKIVQEAAEGYHGGWMPCNERLPEPEPIRFGKQKRDIVLVTLRNGLVKEMTFEFATKEFWEAGDENHIEHWQQDGNDSGCEVIAWRPLPEPYKERESNE